MTTLWWLVLALPRLAGGAAPWQSPGGAVYVGRCGHSNNAACGEGVDGVDYGWVPVDEPPKGPAPPRPRGDAHTARNATASLHVSIASFRDGLCPRTLVDLFSLAKHPGRLHVGLVQQNRVHHRPVVAQRVHRRVHALRFESRRVQPLDDVAVFLRG